MQRYNYPTGKHKKATKKKKLIDKIQKTRPFFFSQNPSPKAFYFDNPCKSLPLHWYSFSFHDHPLSFVQICQIIFSYNSAYIQTFCINIVSSRKCIKTKTEVFQSLAITTKGFLLEYYIAISFLQPLLPSNF